MTADDIIAAARSCLGTPFGHQGRLKGIALDCAGLVVTVAHDIGVEYLDQQGYGRTPLRNQIVDALDAQPCLVALSNVAHRMPGDVLLFRFVVAPQHLAILCYNNLIIHSYETVGICCEHAIDAKWLKLIVKAYRFRNLP